MSVEVGEGQGEGVPTSGEGEREGIDKFLKEGTVDLYIAAVLQLYKSSRRWATMPTSTLVAGS
jgi:hypothetical protein